jgi:uncharacterized protein YlzI (FlbEa/FlbD family)
MHNPESSGILNGKKNILEYPCKDINRTVPYFKELDKSANDTVNQYLAKTLNKLNEKKIVYFDYNYKVEQLEEFPDGAITIDKASV